MLRAIYRPQNYYCLHIDKKAPEALHDTVRSLARCFENVYERHYIVFVNKFIDYAIKHYTCSIRVVQCARVIDVLEFHSLSHRIVASEAIDVTWGWFSVVEPDLVCLKVPAL